MLENCFRFGLCVRDLAKVRKCSFEDCRYVLTTFVGDVFVMFYRM